MAKTSKTVKRKKKSLIVLPPNMEQRGAQVRALAVQMEGTWEPACVHLVGNAQAVVLALRPTDPAQAERIVARLKAFLTELL